MFFSYKPLTRFLIVASLAHSAAAYAGNDADLSNLKQLVAAGNNQAAWSQAQAMRNQWESDTAFDTLYGSLALANGKPHEAVFALERVIVQEPGNVQARFYLAKAYFESGDKENAQTQFLAVRNSNPPAMRREVDNYLGQSTAEKGAINAYVEANIGHDSNANSSTDANTIMPPNGLLIEVDPDARQTSDMYSRTQAGVDYFRPLSSNTLLEVKGRVGNHDNFSSDTYDTTGYRGSVGVRHKAGSELYRVTLTAQDFRLSGSDYQRLVGVNGDWVHQLSSNMALLSNLYVNSLRYMGSGQSTRDINQYIGHLGLQITEEEWTHTLGLMLGNEDALRGSGDHNARDFTSVYYDVKYNIAPEHQLYGRIYLQQANYNGKEPVFLGTREDTYVQLTAGYGWQVNQHWRWKTELGYSDSDSDIGYYGYDRTYLQTGVRYSF